MRGELAVALPEPYLHAVETLMLTVDISGRPAYEALLSAIASSSVMVGGCLRPDGKAARVTATRSSEPASGQHIGRDPPLGRGVILCR